MAKVHADQATIERLGEQVERLTAALSAGSGGGGSSGANGGGGDGGSSGGGGSGGEGGKGAADAEGAARAAELAAQVELQRATIAQMQVRRVCRTAAQPLRLRDGLRLWDACLHAACRACRA